MNDRPLSDFDATVLGQMGHIRAVGRNRLRNLNELDDFVQETVARVYANRAQLRDPAKLKQWIYGIARNTASEWNRVHERWNSKRQTLDEAEAANMPHPLTALEQAESNEQIRQALDKLNPIDRDLLRGRFMDEETYEALQKRHGLSYSAVGIRLHRAKRRLRKLLTGIKVALALALASMKRTAFGGILIMTNTTKIVLGVAAVLILALLGGYLWIEYGGSPDDSDRGLTVEEQSPRIEQNSDGASDQTADEISAPAPQKETSASDESAVEVSTVFSDDSKSAVSTQPDAPQASPQDPFTLELQEGIDELNELADQFVQQFPSSIAADLADILVGIGRDLIKYDEELRGKYFTREERTAKLRAFWLESIHPATEYYNAVTTEYLESEIKNAMDQFFNNSALHKLGALLGLPN